MAQQLVTFAHQISKGSDSWERRTWGGPCDCPSSAPSEFPGWGAERRRPAVYRVVDTPGSAGTRRVECMGRTAGGEHGEVGALGVKRLEPGKVPPRAEKNRESPQCWAWFVPTARELTEQRLESSEGVAGAVQIALPCTARCLTVRWAESGLHGMQPHPTTKFKDRCRNTKIHTHQGVKFTMSGT